jgi:hypothetical protein
MWIATTTIWRMLTSLHKRQLVHHRNTLVTHQQFIATVAATSTTKIRLSNATTGNTIIEIKTRRQR